MTAKSGRDWHPEDVKAAIRKRGASLSQLSLDSGLPEHACRHALRAPYFFAELAIAEFLGLSPRQIWPSRYRPDGSALHPPRTRLKHTPAANQPHRQKQEAA